MTDPVANLIGLLDLEKVEESIFRGLHPPDRKKRLFGGQIIAQALVAAMRTVEEERAPHSLHAYFLRPGDPSVPALFEVERIRDGRSFTTRRIVVIQGGKAIFNMDASFQVREDGLSHQMAAGKRTPPADDEIPEEVRHQPFLSFREDHERLMREGSENAAQNVWFRANGQVPDDPRLHMALLAYESDSALLGTSRLPHRGQYGDIQVASLDHSLWFHHPVNVNDWLLYALDSPAAGGARGYSRGSIFNADGKLVASCIQEGLIRLR